jgi:hypothetical protein
VLQLVASDRLGEVVHSAEAHRLDRILAARHRGQHRDGRRIGFGADAAEHIHAIHARHAQVEEHGVRRLVR